MAQCTHCMTLVPDDAKHCPNCGQPMVAEQVAAAAQPMGATPPAPPLGEKAKQFQDQATVAAKEAWVRIQTAGPAKVALGLMVLSAVIGLIFKGQRSIWASGWPAIILGAVVIAYVAAREFAGQDPLARWWWAPLAAAGYLGLWGVSELRLKLGSLFFLAGAALLVWSYFWPLRSWLAQVGLNWRYALFGYRRPVALGSLLALLSLLFTWVPDRSTFGWWSGGYSYSSYYGDYVWDTMHWYNPGLYLPSYKGYGLTGAVIMMALLLACLFYSAFAPQFAMPKWYRYLPFIGVGYGLLFMLSAGSLSWGQPFFLIGAAAIAWGGYQLSVKGAAQGKFDLHELPLEGWLKRWL